MEKKYEPTPEVRNKVREIKDRLERSESKTQQVQLSMEELDAVSGGGPFDRPPLDPNKEILGWTYTDLHNILCWVYESYGDVILTIGVANDYIPSGYWSEYASYPYPEFIDLPMGRIWCANDFGF